MVSAWKSFSGKDSLEQVIVGMATLLSGAFASYNQCAFMHIDLLKKKKINNIDSH